MELKLEGFNTFMIQFSKCISLTKHSLWPKKQR